MDRYRLNEIKARIGDDSDQRSEDLRWLADQVEKLYQLSLDLVHALLEED